MHIIFDLDGTLVDSLPGIAAALNHTLESRGLPIHSEPKIRGFIGKGSLELVRQAMPADSPTSLAHELDAGFQQAYADTWRQGSVLYPGIESLIQELKSSQHHLAVLSNKPEAFTREIVAHFFPGELFESTLGNSEQFPRKPAPDAALHLLAAWGITAADAHFIGDSDIDQLTAENAAIPFIGVGWGYHPPTRLGQTVAKDVGQLAALLGLSR